MASAAVTPNMANYGYAAALERLRSPLGIGMQDMARGAIGMNQLGAGALGAQDLVGGAIGMGDLTRGALPMGPARGSYSRASRPEQAAAASPADPDQVTATLPFVDPKEQLQRDRLELNRQKFELAKQRYADQQAAAAARMQAQQEAQSNSGQGQRPAAPASSSRTAPQPSRQQAQPAPRAKQPAKPPAAPKKRGKGPTYKYAKSPEQKAREKAREERRAERQRTLERDRYQRNEARNSADPEYNARREATTASEFYAMRNRAKQNIGNEKQAATQKGNEASASDREQREHFNRLGISNEQIDALDRGTQSSPPLSDAGGGRGGRRMVQAWGNKYSRVWIQAKPPGVMQAAVT
jgi:hypothetical protein